ncbi:MAG: hypothetical protein M1833_003863 [Piccolia ochrophora]|nr:MAG: hypothetical protein M1833_003863 [Piccolia ochrophora]
MEVAVDAAGTAARVQPSVGPGLFCCAVLRALLPNKVARTGQAAYDSSLRSYWSLQETVVVPQCIVSPRNAADVATSTFALDYLSDLLSLAGHKGCEFAIRAGGHTPWAGSANIAGGVTIDLSAIKDVAVRPDRTVTSVGPGARWIDVYRELDALSLAIPGGRVPDVGVGGLMNGGGLSYFSPRLGFVCDNVVNYEVVLANGRVVNANATSNPDLWFALKGGSNNFGIVTRFDIKTFTQGKLWGGYIVNPIETRDAQVAAFSELNSASSYDEYAALINSYSYSPSSGGWVVANNIIYTKPTPFPETFKPFTDIQPQLAQTLRISNLSDFVTELKGPDTPKARQLFVTRSYKNSAVLLAQIFDITNATLQTLDSTKLATFAITFQAIPTSITAKAAASGGNALGIDPAVGPLVLVLLVISWADPADDETVAAAGRNLFAQADDAANAAGLLDPWVYLNYAAQWQEPIKGYGAVNTAKLQAASKKYDPKGVFQKRVPGGFKLFT